MLDLVMKKNSNIKSVMLAKGGKSTGVVGGKMYHMGLSVKSALLKFTISTPPPRCNCAELSVHRVVHNRVEYIHISFHYSLTGIL